MLKRCSGSCGGRTLTHLWLCVCVSRKLRRPLPQQRYMSAESKWRQAVPLPASVHRQHMRDRQMSLLSGRRVHPQQRLQLQRGLHLPVGALAPAWFTYRWGTPSQYRSYCCCSFTAARMEESNPAVTHAIQMSTVPTASALLTPRPASQSAGEER